MTVSVSISIDVPSLDEGVAFYCDAFGFAPVATPARGVVVLRAGATSLCLLEKAPGTTPAPGAADQRHYERHWTPVHLDFHVADFPAALAKALAAGAKQEMLFEHTPNGSAAFCSDPFGHGFCLLESRTRP